MEDQVTGRHARAGGCCAEWAELSCEQLISSHAELLSCIVLDLTSGGVLVDGRMYVVKVTVLLVVTATPASSFLPRLGWLSGMKLHREAGQRSLVIVAIQSITRQQLQSVVICILQQPAMQSSAIALVQSSRSAES